MSKMKVLHINTNYSTTALHQKMIDKLAIKGVNNVVFAAVCDKDINNIVINPRENEIISNCFNYYDRVAFHYKQKKIFNSIEKEVKDISKFDLIHAYTLFTDGNCAMKLSQKYGIPYVVAIRDTDVNAFFRLMVHLRPLGVKIMRNASAVFFLSESYKKQVFDKYVPEKIKGELELKTHIVPNGIDDFWLENSVKTAKHLESSNSAKIIFAGRINKRKNPLSTAEAISLLNKEGYDFSFNVVGKIEDNDIFNTLKKMPFVKYLGVQNKNELIETYRKNDIFVMPSLTETFGLVYAEAMSQGLPVIYTRGQGFDGQFDDGEVGYSVDAHSIEDIKDRILQVVSIYETLSKKAFTGVKKFCWDDITEKYVSIYRLITQNRRK